MAAWRAQVSAEQRRHLVLAGTSNLRDVGGYPGRDGRLTRWGTIYRSDCLDQLSDLSQRELLALGVRTIVDLRDNVEVQERPNVFVGSNEVRYRRLPVWEEPAQAEFEFPTFVDGYLRELNECGPCFVAIARGLLEADGLPALIHCAAGKDRTGIVVMLLLAIAGVQPELIATDYALSEACLGVPYADAGRRWLATRGRSWEQYGYLFQTPPERMLTTLDRLEQRWGGVEPYLIGEGLERAEIDALREQLLEP
jgi:protein-tyrosine phosphatase